MKKRVVIITLIVSMLLAFTGCNDKKPEVYEINKNVTKPITENADQPDELNEPDELNGLNLKVYYINSLSVDIGMIGIIDPETKQQINVDALPAGQLISTEVNISTENKEIKWAIYNKNGELYSESTTDVSDANESVWFIIRGDKAVDGVDALFDATKEEITKAIQ